MEKVQSFSSLPVNLLISGPSGPVSKSVKSESTNSGPRKQLFWTDGYRDTDVRIFSILSFDSVAASNDDARASNRAIFLGSANLLWILSLNSTLKQALSD
jgi:hypothetical protein